MVDQVKVGGVWLNRFNGLNSLSSRLQIHFDSSVDRSSPLLIAKEGLLDSENAAFGVYAKDPLLNLFPRIATEKKLSLKTEIYWMSLILMFIAVRILMQLRRKNDEQKLHIDKFNRWLSTLNPKLRPKETKSLEEAFTNLKEGVTELFKDSFDQVEASRQRVRSMGEKQKQLEQKILSFKKEHLQYHQSESMRYQMKKTEKAQSKLLDEVYSELEDLSDSLVHGLAHKAHGLYNFSQTWSEELKTSARKFLRTLSES